MGRRAIAGDAARTHNSRVRSIIECAHPPSVPSPCACALVLQAFLAFNFASNYTAFREALSVYVAPSQNFIYADAEGNIAYQMPG